MRILLNKVPLKREAIAGAQNLRLVAVVATGTDVVDRDACAERGVADVNIRNYAVNTVPEHTFALILRYGAASPPTAMLSFKAGGKRPGSSAFSIIPFRYHRMHVGDYRRRGPRPICC
jgi:phosphoglycerate dehydrogenase-like enzyme